MLVCAEAVVRAGGDERRATFAKLQLLSADIERASYRSGMTPEPSSAGARTKAVGRLMGDCSGMHP